MTTDIELNQLDKPVTVKVRGKFNTIVLAIIILAILALIGLIIFIFIEAGGGKASESKANETNTDAGLSGGGDCSAIGHETYNLTRDAKMGNYSRFAVAADNRECSTVGKGILEKGGSAVDAAIAAALCNSIMNAQSMGIGGGHFMVIYIKSTNKSYIIDAREAAPLSAHRDMFVGQPDKALYGGLATPIPGEIYGYYKAHQLGGKLPWKELFKPSIKLAEEGFPLSRALAKSLRSKEVIKNNTGLREIFVNPLTNDFYKENDTIRMPKLARTLKNLSESGYELFYKGSLTPIIVSEINRSGGNVSLEDFKRYEPRVHQDRFLVRLDDNLRMYTVPPPSSGVLIPAAIRIMKAFGFQNMSRMSEESLNKFYHRLVEALKHVYAKRYNFGDELFVNMTSILREINNQTFIDEVVRKIDDKQTFPDSHYGKAFANNEFGTAHISVLAPNGDAVSFTSSINNYFGAKYIGEQTGIIYSDTMDDFSTPGLPNSFGFEPSEANFIAPTKRPLSSMSPVIVVDNSNQVRLVLGASGGSKIISAVAQVAMKSLFMGMDIKSAIDEPRIHHQLKPDYAQIEEGFPHSIQENLKKIGHETRCFSFGGSTVQGIQVLDKTIFAYSDPRKGGAPDGI